MITSIFGSIIDKSMKQLTAACASRQTIQVLRSIATHIDSKSERATITVAIQEIPAGYVIVVSPDTSVYPNVHRRRSADLQRVQDHVLIYHFPEIVSILNDDGHVIMKLGSVVPGLYQYVFSSTYRQRRWIKLV